MFPKEFTKLNKQVRLYTDIKMEILHGIGILTSLHIASYKSNKHSWGGTASKLGNLRNLNGRLNLQGFSDAGIVEELKKVNMGAQESIEELNLSFYSHLNHNQEDVNHVKMLAALEPHPNLVALEIYRCQFKVLPNWMMEMTGYGGHALDHLVLSTLIVVISKSNCHP